MMFKLQQDVFVFGTLENSECCAWDIANFADDVKLGGFVEDSPEITEKMGVPVLSYQRFIEDFTKSRLIIPLSKNRSRQAVFERARGHGVQLYSFISPLANVWDRDAIGENCYIQEFNNIQFGTTVGDNCILWAGNHVGHHGHLGISSQLTSHVVISGRCRVGERCYFGVNSSVRDGLVITDEVVLGMSSGLVKNARKSGLYVGFPAMLSGSAEKYIR